MEAGVFERVQVRGRQHPRISDDNEVIDVVSGLEGAQHRQQRDRLGSVAFELVNLQREPVRGDE